ncbi:Ahc2p NDAI_0I00180 [Naumovozyma dairenensis CBS 421]|uniref:Uncharacterized protein n=1 Tax=Naumovozyma dairenensis (strain ATCC 10597 / BCRC 20456 / CBS 421 / NBRC 0211 / NRRL Y-12639) TaxID=1071378 RepID=G0WFM6_NAUDC|nr:hypothetical protein NDAI_0I00180 [Naumovozyma dairenensis CBS 421]CCD26587.1 hypothetical protein NDAI_0I00180 [Naumovozyma dairenensis CBS 421]
MLTSETVREQTIRFQQDPLASNEDYSILKHHREHLNRKLEQQQHFTKKLLLLYSKITESNDFEEFIDTLKTNEPLLKEIFTLEGYKKRSRSISNSMEIDWFKYGLDITEYIANNDELLSLYNNGLL